MTKRKLASARAFDREFVFESYGVRIKIQASSLELLQKAEQTARKALLNRLQILENTYSEHVFGISSDDTGRLFLYQNGEKVSHDDSEFRFFKFVDTMLRITVAEHAVDKVFVHAGVVGWKGKAIVLPANSFGGKTTLVAELVRNGAEYYSDEYAVLDEEGLVHAFPRNLTVRYFDGDGVREKEVLVGDLGGKVGSRPIPIGLVLLTEYSDDVTGWQPERLTRGNGIMEMIPHTIPRRSNTDMSLKVLNRAVSDAIILKSQRGEAADFVIELLSFFDNFTNLAKIT